MVKIFQYRFFFAAISFAVVIFSGPSFSKELKKDVSLSQANNSTENENTIKGNDLWVAFTLENDVFAFGHQSDDGYTNGAAIAWGYDTQSSFAKIQMPEWIRLISDWTYLNDVNREHFSINYFISQKMYTPNDLQKEELIVNDRLYAGTLTWTTRIHSFDSEIANSLGLTLGIAGPSSYAEQTQKDIHKLTNSAQPQGWDNQVSNEAVFQIDAEHIRRLFHYNENKFLQFDTNFYNKAALGNLKSDVTSGFSFRIGSQLEKSFAYLTPAPARAVNNFEGESGFNWSLSLSAFAVYVFNDISIDGNTFTDSHTAELINEQALLSLGLTLDWGNWGLIFSSQKASDEFEGQEGGGYFGGINIAYHL